jgi:hypothetical protein
MDICISSKLRLAVLLGSATRECLSVWSFDISGIVGMHHFYTNENAELGALVPWEDWGSKGGDR